MSSADSYWRGFGFPICSWSGASWGAGSYSDGYTDDDPIPSAPATQLLHQLRFKLQEDDYLAGAFATDGIHVLEAAPVLAGDGITDLLPCLFLWSGANEQVDLPVSATDETISLFVAVAMTVRFIQTVPEGHPTVADPLHRIKHVVRNSPTLKVTVDGQQQELAEVSFIRTHQTMPLEDLGERLYGFMQTLQIDYTVKIKRDTGRIWNLSD